MFHLRNDRRVFMVYLERCMTLRKGYMGELENRRVFMTYLKGFMTLEKGYMEGYGSVMTYLEGYMGRWKCV